MSFKASFNRYLKPLVHHPVSLLLLFAVILDFTFTTVGMLFVGPQGESNPNYRLAWQNGNYAVYFGTWVLAGFIYTPFGILFTQVKSSFAKPSRTRAVLVAFMEVIFVYLALSRLVLGPLGWSTQLGCNYLSSINSCLNSIRSNPWLSLLFQILNALFPTQFIRL